MTNAEAFLNPDNKRWAMPEQKQHSGNLVDEFLHSAAYAAVQEPLIGAAQLVDHVSGNRLNLAKTVSFMDGPSKAQFGSADWYAQTVGGAVGMLAPFLAVKGAMKPLLGDAAAVEGAGLLSKQAMLGMSLKEALATGFVYSAVLQPSQGEGADFWKNRLANGTIGAAQFGALTAGSMAMGELADTAAARSLGVGGVLRNPIVGGALSGVPAGVLATEMNSLYYNHKLASSSDVVQTAASMALVGGVFGAHQEFMSKAPRVAEAGKQALSSVRTNVANLGTAIADFGGTMGAGGMRPAYAYAGAGDMRMRSMPDSFMKMTTIGPDITGDQRGTTAGGSTDGRATGSTTDSSTPGAKSEAGAPVESTTTTDSSATATEKDAAMKAAADAAKQRGAVARGELDALAAKFNATVPTTESLSSLYDVLAKTPEVDEHIKELYKKNFDNPVMMQSIEGFYKPAPELSLTLLQDPLKMDAYNRLHALMSDTRNVDAPQPMVQRDLQIFLRTRSDSTLTPEQELGARLAAVEYFARTSTDPVAVAAADGAVKPLLEQQGQTLVDHSKLLTDFGPHQRQLPLTAQDINEALAYSQAEKNALEGGGVTPITPQAEGPLADPVTGSTDAGPKPADVSIPSDVQAKIEAKVDAKVAGLRTQLESGTPAQQEQAALDMLSYLGHASAKDWFPKWRDVVANDVVIDSSSLKLPEVTALGDNTVRDFLSGDWRNKGYGRDISEQFESKLGALKTTAQTFTPETATRLLELGKDDPAALIRVLDATKAFGGQDYKEWVESQAAGAKSLSELTGEQSALPLAQFRLEKAFPGDKATVDKLLAMKEADPQFDIDSLASSVNNPKIGDSFRKALLENLKENDPRMLTADYIFTQMKIEKTYSRNPEAVAKLKELAKEDPAAMKDLLMDPKAARSGGGRPKKPPTREEKQLSFAYTDLIGELAPQATSLGQLQSVAVRLRAGDKAGAFAAAKALRPADEAAWSKVQDWIKAVATGEPAHLPQRDGRPKQTDLPPPEERPPQRPPQLPPQGNPRDSQPVDNNGTDQRPPYQPEEPPPVQPAPGDAGDPSQTIPDPNLEGSQSEEFPGTEYPEQSGIDYPGAKPPEGMGKDGVQLPPEIGRWAVGPVPEDTSAGTTTPVEGGNGGNGGGAGDGSNAGNSGRIDQTAQQAVPEMYGGRRSGKSYRYEDGEEDYRPEKKIKKVKGGGRQQRRDRGGARNWTDAWMNGELDE